MASPYTGLCVGGPMAGKTVARPKQFFKCEELLASLKASLADDPVPTQEHAYSWQHIGPFALWIHESLNLSTALETLALSYMKEHNDGRG